MFLQPDTGIVDVEKMLVPELEHISAEKVRAEVRRGSRELAARSLPTHFRRCSIFLSVTGSNGHTKRPLEVLPSRILRSV